MDDSSYGPKSFIYMGKIVSHLYIYAKKYGKLPLAKQCNKHDGKWKGELRYYSTFRGIIDLRVYYRGKNIKTLYWAQNRFYPGVSQNYDHDKQLQRKHEKQMNLETQVWRSEAHGRDRRFRGANEAHDLMQGVSAVSSAIQVSSK